MASVTKSCATGTNISGWTNPSNVTASDNNRANAPNTADVMVAKNFSFAIPAGATINGLACHIEGYGAGNNQSRRNLTVQITKDGTNGVGEEKVELLAGTTSADETTHTIGGAADLWTTTLSVAEVNSSNFGFRLSPNVQSGYERYVDHIQATVYYTEAVPVSADALSSFSNLFSKIPTLKVQRAITLHDVVHGFYSSLAEAGTGVQHLLDVLSALQAVSSGLPVISLGKMITAQKALHTVTSGMPNEFIEAAITANKVFHGLHNTQPSGFISALIDVQSAVHDLLTASAILQADNLLTTVNVVHDLLTSRASIQSAIQLLAQNAAHDFTSTILNVSTLAAFSLSVRDALHSLHIEPASPVVSYIVTPQGTVHELLTTMVGIRANSLLTPSMVVHNLLTDRASIQRAIQLLAQNTVHNLNSTLLNIGTLAGFFLSVRDAVHSLRTEPVATIVDYIVTPQSIVHDHHASIASTLLPALVMAVRDAIHDHLAGRNDLAQQHLLTASKLVHDITSEQLDLQTAITVVTADSVHEMLTGTPLPLVSLKPFYAYLNLIAKEKRYEWQARNNRYEWQARNNRYIWTAERYLEG